MTVIIDGIEYLPAPVVAQLLATTETKVLMLLKKKILSGLLVEGSWLVTTDSLDCYDARAAQPEQQAGCSTSCGGSGCGCH